MAKISKVSEITKEYLASYLHIDSPDEQQLDELDTMLGSAIGFVKSFTGLDAVEPVAEGETPPETPDDVVTLDTHAEFVTAVVVLVQNEYDNRSFYVDKGQPEAVVNSILGMHRTNLL